LVDEAILGMEADRRSSPRYRFIADAEVVEVSSDTKLNARTSDLSIGGCFLDMLNPSLKGTEIRVRISHGGTAFTALGRVAFRVPTLGMGVAFTTVDGNQVAVLQKWLLEAKGESDSGDLKAADGSIGRSGT
jgi:PilZ domain